MVACSTVFCLMAVSVENAELFGYLCGNVMADGWCHVHHSMNVFQLMLDNFGIRLCSQPLNSLRGCSNTQM
jgi:hypothetical protein